jgi:phage RecT family recombinase
MENKPDKKTEQLSITQASSTTPAIPNKKPLAVWQQALVKAEGKFLAISDPEKTKVELGFASQLIQNNESLKKCDAESIINAVINVARTGITLNPIMKLAHLVPRNGKCVLDFDYKGLVKTLKDNGCIKHIDAFIVYEDEVFKQDSASNTIIHEIIYAETEAEQKKRKPKGVYSKVIFPDNSILFTQLMPMWEIEKTEKVSTASKSDYSPWKTWREEMIKKTKIKRDYKMLIAGVQSPQLQEVLKIEEENTGIEFKKAGKRSIADTFLDDAEDAQVL